MSHFDEAISVPILAGDDIQLRVVRGLLSSAPEAYTMILMTTLPGRPFYAQEDLVGFGGFSMDKPDWRRDPIVLGVAARLLMMLVEMMKREIK